MKYKKHITVHGRLIGNLEVGRGAVFCAEDKIYYTSPVVAIQRQTKRYIQFETQNTRYCLLLDPIPQITVLGPKVCLASCA